VLSAPWITRDDRDGVAWPPEGIGAFDGSCLRRQGCLRQWADWWIRPELVPGGGLVDPPRAGVGGQISSSARTWCLGCGALATRRSLGTLRNSSSRKVSGRDSECCPRRGSLAM